MKPSSQSGNALFIILIAVVLLAALSVAVTQGMRGGGSDLSAERSRLLASEILEYTNALGTATSQLKLRGCTDTELNFFNNTETGYTNGDAPDDDSCDIFSTVGGGLNWSTLPDGAQGAGAVYTQYYINGTNEISGTRSSDADLAVYAEVRLEVCEELNELLGMASATPAVDGDGFQIAAANKFTGAYAENADVTAYSNSRAACFEDDTTERYYYYRVLISR